MNTDYDWADPRRSCTRKKAYSTFDFARKVARKVNSEEEYEAVRAYECRHCGQFHIGRNPAKGFR